MREILCLMLCDDNPSDDPNYSWNLNLSLNRLPQMNIYDPFSMERSRRNITHNSRRWHFY